MSDGSAAFLSLHPNGIIWDKSEGMQMCFLGQPSSQPLLASYPQKKTPKQSLHTEETFHADTGEIKTMLTVKYYDT